MYKLLLPLLLIPTLMFAATEQTIAIIKPDAVQKKHVGDILSRYEKEGFAIRNLKMTTLSKEQAGKFYSEHNGKPFYDELTNYMTSGPVVVILLENDDAIAKNRKLIGTTNPQQAEPNTLRALYGESKSHNGLHGSDSQEAANREKLFFFN